MLNANRTAPVDGAESRNLPVVLAKQRILQLVDRRQVSIIVSETGSGKTTQVPQFLFSNGYAKNGSICITQPRRIATVNVAKRVAYEMNTNLGTGLVGYSIRFQNVTSHSNKLKFLTDGMLLREHMIDGALSHYNVIIVDEVHERSARTDVLLGLLKLLLNRRPDLKVVIMSATLDCNVLSNFFTGSEILELRGRTYAIECFYMPFPEEDYVEACLTAILEIHFEYSANTGDVLVFLPGQDDIEALHRLLCDKASYIRRLNKSRNQGDVVLLRLGSKCFKYEENIREMIILPLFASLPFNEQLNVFRQFKKNARKVILATNVAETSITIPGVQFVVDSGYCKERTVCPDTFLETLAVRPISKSAAIQRMGRAGRERPGYCYRLYSEKQYVSFEDRDAPEIVRCDPSQFFLELKVLGIQNPMCFPLIDPPSNRILFNAAVNLVRIGALDESGDITSLGRQMTTFPLPPYVARLIIDSIDFHCTGEVITIVSMFCAGNIWAFSNLMTEPQMKLVEESKKRLVHVSGDHLTLLGCFLLWNEARSKKEFCSQHGLSLAAMSKALEIRNQLKDIFMTNFGLPHLPRCTNDGEWDKVRQCLAKSFRSRLARWDSEKNSFITEAHGTVVLIHPSSVLFNKIPRPKNIIYDTLVRTKKSFARNVTSVEDSWL